MAAKGKQTQRQQAPSTVPQCLYVPQVSQEEVRALRALESGEATAGQQRMALKMIIAKLSRAYDMEYVPDHPDQSSFLSGRAFVGKQVFKFLRVDLSKLREVDQDG